MLLFVFLGTLIIFFGHAYWVIHPIGSKLKQAPTFKLKSFQLSDLFVLMFMIQLPFAILAASGGFRYQSDAIIQTVAGTVQAFVAFCLWLAAVLALSELGISQPLKRIVTQLFIFPWAVAGGFVNAGLFAYLTSERTILAFWALILAITVSVVAYQLALRWVVASVPVIDELNTAESNVQEMKSQTKQSDHRGN